MASSMYRFSAPVFAKGLRALSKLVDKAEAYAAEKGLAPEAILDARLASDMFPFSKQIQLASDSSKGAVARLAGVEIPSFPDEEKTFDELRERIAKTIAFIEGVDASAFDGSDAREISLKFKTWGADFTGENFLATFSIPNFFFHVTTAYAILRAQGVTIGKSDYLDL